MKKILLILSFYFSLISWAQTFPVGHMSINFKDATRSGGYSISGGIAMPGSGRNVGTEVYYPATVAGNNKPVALGQFPIVVFGHGFAMTYDNYDNIYNRLAAMGYIVMLPRTESGIFPTPVHADFGTDLKFLANQGLALNTINTPTALATFNGKVLQKSAIGGHSMGAGCSFLAASANNTVTCIFNFAAATSNNTPNSIASASLVTVPALLISGQMDSVADSTVQNSHYNSTASSKKFHAIIKGVTHCDFGNGQSGTCTIGQGACSGAGCNAILFAKYMTYVEPFLAHQLKNDCSEGNRFMDSINSNSPNRVGRKITGTIGSTVTVNIAGTSSLCAGSQATLTASGATSYTWTNGISNGVAFTPTTTQTYSVIATNSLGCTKTATTNIIVNNSPTVTANVTNSVICNGASTTLNGGGAASYTWTSGVTNGTAFTPTATANYTVIGTDANGCKNSATKNIIVNNLPTVTANATNSVICNGASTTLNGGGATSYSWTNGVTNGTAFTPTATTNYTVIGTDANGCKNSATKNITVNNLPNVTASATNSVICNGASTTLNGGGATTYSWTNGVTNNVAFTPTATANYTVIGTDANGCKNSATKNITVNNLPNVTASASNSVICNGASTILNGGGATTYSWTNGVTNGTAFTPSATTNYTVIGTDANGCKNSATKNITVNNLPTVTATTSNTLLCSGQTASLSAIGASTYTWSTTETSAVIVVTPTSQTTYTVNGTDANGCNNATTITQDVSTCTGLVEAKSTDLDIHIFPNPTKENITVFYEVNSNEIITFSLFDITGKLVYSIKDAPSNGSINKELDIKNLEAGIYILSIQQNKFQKSYKIIKQ